MNVRISPSTAAGRVSAPPSKSVAHRALIAAALSEGCLLTGIGQSDDVIATLRALARMGARVERTEAGVILGGLDPFRIPACEIDCGESGSTLRFLIPLCLISGNPVRLFGRGRLMSRPLTEYAEFCKEHGFLFEQSKDSLTLCGRLRAGNFSLSAARSSQFITGLLLVLPLLAGESTLEITGQAQSMSYVALSEQVMNDFGIVLRREHMKYTVLGGQQYRRTRFAVEGDWSGGAFLLALAHLGGKVEVTGLCDESAQGDRVVAQLFQKLGREQIDLSDCPDLAPILFALSAFTGGAFTGCRRLRFKESDRIAAMQTELSKCGITLTAGEDEVRISPLGLHPPTEAIDGHNDHRIVMAMSVLLSKTGGKITGAEAVAKSYPDFFEVLKGIGIEVELC